MVSMKTDGRFDNNEAFYFGGFTLDTGGSILPMNSKNKTCFAIGDSITAGKNILGLYQSAAEMGYISIMGDNLNTRISRNAHAGTGLINPAGSTYCLNYANNVKNDLVDNYDHRPDFITINHGQNDYNYTGVTSDVFKQKYNELINRLKHKFPGVSIFCIVPFSQYFAAEIADVVSQNPTLCILVQTAGWGITYTDGVHPNVAGSITAGNKLADFLLNYFGRHYFTM